MRRLTRQRSSSPVVRKPKPPEPAVQGQPAASVASRLSVAGLGNALAAAASSAADSGSRSRVRVYRHLARRRGSRGAGTRRRCPARRRSLNPEACVPRDLSPYVSEGGLEHGFRCEFPGSGKSCNKGNMAAPGTPRYSVMCSLFVPLPALIITRRQVRSRWSEAISGWVLPVADGRRRPCGGWSGCGSVGQAWWPGGVWQVGQLVEHFP